jgi:hypothetical protein
MLGDKKQELTPAAWHGRPDARVALGPLYFSKSRIKSPPFGR